MPLLSHLEMPREQIFIASFSGLRKHAHITRPLPHVLPAQDPAKLQDVSVQGVEPEVVKHRQQLMQRNRRSLGINRAAIDMRLEREATSSPKRFALCMAEAQVRVLETE